MKLKNFHPSNEVKKALKSGLPIVALESTVITHGLPYPENIRIACELEAIVRNNDVCPATVAVMDGKLHVGLKPALLERLATFDSPMKVSLRELPTALSGKRTGGTTVAATSFAAASLGVRVFSTGGIGGVHRSIPGSQGILDVSADLMALQTYPVIVVCAGPKAILDIPGTMEVLESYSVPVIGYKTDFVPAFYSSRSKVKVQQRYDTAEEIARFALMHWELGFETGILVVTPIEEEYALRDDEVEKFVDLALKNAVELGVSGQDVTPFLLAKMNEFSQGTSIKSNLALLRNNVRVASAIAVTLKKAK